MDLRDWRIEMAAALAWFLPRVALISDLNYLRLLGSTRRRAAASTRFSWPP
jgi:hypothetical protein